MKFEPRQKNKAPEAVILATFLCAGIALAFSAIEGIAGGGILQTVALVLFGAMIFVAVRYKFTSFRYTVKVAEFSKKSLHHEDDEEEKEEEVPLTPDGKEPPVTAYPPKRLLLTVERRQGRGAWVTECLVRLSEVHACYVLPEDKETAGAALKSKEYRRAPRYKYFKNLVAPEQTVLIADTAMGKTVIYLETDRKISEYLKSVAAYNSGK